MYDLKYVYNLFTDPAKALWI